MFLFFGAFQGLLQASPSVFPPSPRLQTTKAESCSQWLAASAKIEQPLIVYSLCWKIGDHGLRPKKANKASREREKTFIPFLGLIQWWLASHYSITISGSGSMHTTLVSREGFQSKRPNRNCGLALGMFMGKSKQYSTVCSEPQPPQSTAESLNTLCLSHPSHSI